MSQDNDSYEAGLSRIEDTVEPAQNTELVTQVSSIYLSSQLEEKGKQSQTKASIEKQATKFKGKSKQFEFNAQVDEFTSCVADNADDPQKVRELTTEAKGKVKKRQQSIRIAEKNKDGWLVVEEYKSDDLASDTADEKRIKKANLAAEKRRSDNPRGNAINVKKFKTGDNQLFSGERNVAYIVLCGI